MRPSAPSTAPETWSPVAGPQRIPSLDILRGFALLGVLVANTLAFAYPLASSSAEVVTWRGTAAADVAVQRVMGFMIEGKFYLLLSVLFGAGMMLQAARAQRAQRSFAGYALRRQSALLALGLVHGLVLFAGDILAVYAIVALCALPFTRMRQRAIVASAALSALVGLAGLTTYASVYRDQPFPTPPDWAHLARTPSEASTVVVEAGARLVTSAGWSRHGCFDTLANEVRIAASGSWPEQVRLRAAIGLGYALPHRLLLLGPVLLSFFLAGMSLVRRPGPGVDGPIVMPVFDLGQDDASRYWVMSATGVTVGLLLVAGAEGVRIAWPRSVAAVSVYWMGTLGGAAVQAAGYAAGVLAFSVRSPDSAVARSLAAVGRTALSTYLLQSLLLGLVFYRPGLGLITRMTALPTVAVAVPIFAVGVWISRWWLARYTMGPFEWVWRSASYGHRLSLRR